MKYGATLTAPDGTVTEIADITERKTERCDFLKMAAIACMGTRRAHFNYATLEATHKNAKVSIVTVWPEDKAC